MEYTHSPESHKFHGASVPGYTGHIPGLRLMSENTVGQRFATASARAINTSLGVTPAGSPISPGFNRGGYPQTNSNIGSACGSKKKTSADSSYGSKRSSNFMLAEPADGTSSKKTSDLSIATPNASLARGSKNSSQSCRNSASMLATTVTSGSSMRSSRYSNSQLNQSQSKKSSTIASQGKKQESIQSRRSEPNKNSPLTPSAMESPTSQQLRQGAWQPSAGFPATTRVRPGGEIPGYRGHFTGQNENIVGQTFRRANEAKLEAFISTSRHSPGQVTDTEGHMFGSQRSPAREGKYEY